MTARKRNEFLEAIDSDEEDALPTDTEATDSRIAGLASSCSKKRKLATSIATSDGETDGSDIVTSPTHTASTVILKDSKPTPRTNAPVSGSPSTTSQLRPSRNHIHLPTVKTKTSKPGVIYLSRIPPFMRPSTVRTHLSLHGSITKLFLTPEPPSHYSSRKRHGGNKKHSYIDGWVEFSRKKDAKKCVDAINGRIVGGKKGGWYRDDVWNARYLRGFTWGDLMEGVRAEEREREQRVRVGVGREGRERREFLKQVEMGKVEETRRKKREAKGGSEGPRNGGVGVEEPESMHAEGVERKGGGFERRFRQNEVKGKPNRGPEHPDEVKRVLGKIF